MDVAAASEPELLTASRLGDRAAFGELVDRCARMVSAIAFAATRDRVLSEDISQDTFVAAWRDLGHLRDAEALRPWLCGIARNLALKARRDLGREVPTDEVPPTVGAATALDSLTTAELQRLVGDAVTRVPEPYREALVLFYFEEQSARAVAAALGVSEEVVFKRLSRGRQHIAADLQPLFDEELTYRRPRRRLSACVLALLPRKGFTMSKIGAIGLSAAATVTLVVALPRLDAAPHKARTKPASAQTAGHVTLPVRAAAPPHLAAPPASALTCSAAAHHLVEVGLSTPNFRDIAANHPDRTALVIRRLEQLCRDEAWSETDINCVVKSGEYDQPELCVPVTNKTRIKPVPAITDTRCDAVGPHVGQIMVAEMVGPARDDVAAQIIDDPADILRDSKDACRDEDWSESRRQCYAKATKMNAIVRCNLDESER